MSGMRDLRVPHHVAAIRSRLNRRHGRRSRSARGWNGRSAERRGGLVAAIGDRGRSPAVSAALPCPARGAAAGCGSVHARGQPPGWADPFVLLALLPSEPRLLFIADRKETMTVWWKRLVLRSLGVVVAVDRENRSDRGAIEASQGILRSGAVMGAVSRGTGQPRRGATRTVPPRRGLPRAEVGCAGRAGVAPRHRGALSRPRARRVASARPGFRRPRRRPAWQRSALPHSCTTTSPRSPSRGASRSARSSAGVG